MENLYMQCYNPRLAFTSKLGGRLIFTAYSWSQFIHAKNGFRAPLNGPTNSDKPIKIPCSKCYGCRLDLAKERAIRFMHELKSKDDKGMFLTLTYSDEHLQDGKFNECHIKDFVRELRRITPKISTFGVAEYGRKNFRPHFHLLVFGFQFNDLKQEGTRRGYDFYSSETLNSLWKYGLTEIGNITTSSASYVARYTHKKNANSEKIIYQKKLPPEKFVCVSRRPGLGFDHAIKYLDEWLRVGHVTNYEDGSKHPIPRYYKRLLEKFYPEKFIEMRDKFRDYLDEKSWPDDSQERTKNRAEHHRHTTKKMERNL